MTYDQFLHLCAASAAVGNVKRIIVFGANSTLPWLHENGIDSMETIFPPEELSREIDITAGNDDIDTLIDASIGELSYFDKTFNYYAHGTGIEGFIAPGEWLERAKTIANIQTGVEVVVPHPTDIIVSKIIAGREKDLTFCEEMLALFPLSSQELSARVASAIDAHPSYKAQAEENLLRAIYRIERKHSQGPGQ